MGLLGAWAVAQGEVPTQVLTHLLPVHVGKFDPPALLAAVHSWIAPPDQLAERTWLRVFCLTLACVAAALSSVAATIEKAARVSPVSTRAARFLAVANPRSCAMTTVVSLTVLVELLGAPHTAAQWLTVVAAAAGVGIVMFVIGVVVTINAPPEVLRPPSPTPSLDVVLAWARYGRKIPLKECEPGIRPWTWRHGVGHGRDALCDHLAWIVLVLVPGPLLYLRRKIGSRPAYAG